MKANAPQYGYIGHGTLLYATGEKGDEFYCHEVTTIHKENEDWDTIAFVPGAPDDQAAWGHARVLGAAYAMLEAINAIRSDPSRRNLLSDTMDKVNAAFERATKPHPELR